MSDPLNTERPEAPEMEDPYEEPERSETIVVPATPAQPPADTRSAAQKVQETASNVYHILRMIVLAALGFIVALFVVRNWDDVEFDYVAGDSEIPLAVVMLLFTLIGILVGMLLHWFLSRSRASRR